MKAASCALLGGQTMTVRDPELGRGLKKGSCLELQQKHRFLGHHRRIAVRVVQRVPRRSTPGCVRPDGVFRFLGRS